MKKPIFSARSFSLLLTLLAALGASDVSHTAHAIQAAKADDANNVSIQNEGGLHRVKGSTYEALIGADGTLPSLQIGGQEFLVSEPELPRGAYLYQDGPLKLSQISESDQGVVTAKSQKASLRYQFSSDAISITAKNASQKQITFYIVFDPAINAFFNNQGDATRPFANLAGQKTTTWFGGNARLSIEGGDSVFGPWSKKFQVWQAILPPGESRTVFLTAGTATEADKAKIALLPPPADN